MAKPTLTPEQLAATLKHLSLPLEPRPPTLEYLQTLMIRHASRVPFDNIALHYSPTRKLSLDVADLFDKIVVRSRGGYCMEVNAFFAALLRTLGYDLYTIGGRVCSDGTNYTATGHMNIVVIIDSVRYFVDVGYGAEEALMPLPLKPFKTAMSLNRTARLEHRPIHLNSANAPNQNLWVFSVAQEGGEFVEQYALSETELFPQDYKMMNYFTSSHPDSFFSTAIMAVRVISEGDDVKGLYSLFRDEVKHRNEKGEKTLVEKLETEEQRVKALEKYFAIVLNEEEKKAIIGTKLALPQ